MTHEDFVKFGKVKDYVQNPHLLDIHVERLVEAHRVVGSYMKDTELLRSGLLRFEDFVGDPGLIAGVVEQIRLAPIQDFKHKDSLIAGLKGTPAFDVMALLWKVVRGVFQENMGDVVTNRMVNHTYLQHLFNKPDDGDIQKVFHSDSFFHCVKFWYFPLPVSVEEGAFWYVPDSPILTDGLISWHTARVEDLKRGKAEAWRGSGHLEGSFRINEEEISSLGLKPIPITVKEDTLVVANVHGFHRRGDTVRPTHRFSIHGSIRVDNPFAYAPLLP